MSLSPLILTVFYFCYQKNKLASVISVWNDHFTVQEGGLKLMLKDYVPLWKTEKEWRNKTWCSSPGGVKHNNVKLEKAPCPVLRV